MADLPPQPHPQRPHEAQQCGHHPPFSRSSSSSSLPSLGQGPDPSPGPNPERQPAFRRSFSETPEPLPHPFGGLARLLVAFSDFTARRVRRRRPSAQEEGDTGLGAAEVAALERAEAGGGGDYDDGEELRELRARYVSNTKRCRTGGPTPSRSPMEEGVRAEDFLMKLAVALQRYGCPVPRTEALLAALAARLRVDGRFYLLPNLLLCSFISSAGSETHMVPCPQDFDAYRYRKTSHLVCRMLISEAEAGDGGRGSGSDSGQRQQRMRSRACPLLEAVAKLESIVHSPPLYPKPILFLCHVLSAAASTLIFWRGDLQDAAMVAISAVCVAIIAVPGSDHFFFSKVRVLLSAILTGFVSTIGSSVVKTLCSKAIYYGPLIVLLPGWSLTFSLMEFSMGTALLGTTHMASALIVGLLLGYGVQIGHDVAIGFFSEQTRAAMEDWGTTSEHCAAQPWYVQLAAFPFVGIPLCIILHAAPRQWPAMLLTAGASVALLKGPLADTPEHLAVFFVSLLVGIAANAHARATASPALIVIVNATFLIVPGSMAVTSAKSYLQNNLAQGYNTALLMLLITISIAAGLLAAQGLALGVAALGAWCDRPRDAEARRHKSPPVRGGGGGVDSVYF